MRHRNRSCREVFEKLNISNFGMLHNILRFACRRGVERGYSIINGNHSQAQLSLMLIMSYKKQSWKHSRVKETRRPSLILAIKPQQETNQTVTEKKRKNNLKEKLKEKETNWNKWVAGPSPPHQIFEIRGTFDIL